MSSGISCSPFLFDSKLPLSFPSALALTLSINRLTSCQGMPSTGHAPQEKKKKRGTLDPHLQAKIRLSQRAQASRCCCLLLLLLLPPRCLR